jgi:hypothetical protein
VTHCGVNAHFQNGIAERRIRDLQDRAPHHACPRQTQLARCY